MKRFSSLMLAVAVAVVGLFVAPKGAEAVPSFARQVGVGCDACHFQHLPKLNAFGREFKVGGMTQASVDLIEDDGLSLPSVLNLSVVNKWRYKKTSTKASLGAGKVESGTNRGVLDLPDEVNLFVGGRVGDNFGYLTEGSNADGNNKFVFSKDFGGLQGGAFVFTSGGGAGAGMEIANNAYKMNREWENKSYTTAQFALGGAAATSAAGIGGFASNELFFANVSLWAPVAPGSYDTNFDLSTYIRLAITPKVWDGVDLIIGYQGSSGKTKNTTGSATAPAAAVTETKTESTAIDFQAQMEDVSGMSVEISGAYQSNPKGTAFNAGTKSETGMNLNAAFGFSNHLGLKVNYLTIDNDEGVTTADWNATSVGGWWSLRQNIEFTLEYTAFGGTGRTYDNYMVLMLEFGV